MDILPQEDSEEERERNPEKEDSEEEKELKGEGVEKGHLI